MWARVCGREGPALLFGLHALQGSARRRAGGRLSLGGSLSTLVRGVWCQALFLPRPPVPWAGQPDFGDPCVLGGVGVGVGTQHGPHSVRSCNLSLRAVGVAGGRPLGGGTLRRCERRLSSGALPPPAAQSQGGLSGSAIHVLCVPVCQRGGPALSLWLACTAGGCVPWGSWEPVPRGLAFQRCEGRLVSDALPPPAACPLGRAAGVLQPVFPGRGWCGCGDPGLAPQRALLRAVVARCGAGGRASPGGLPCAVVRGV